MRSRLAFTGTLLACLSVLVGSVHAQTTLTGGRKLAFKVNASPSKSSGTIGFVKDPQLVALTSPLCPVTSTLRLSSSSQVRAEIVLPCAKWAIVGGGFQYKDKLGAAGGVQRILYKGGKLSIKMKGAALAPLNGPVTFAEVRLGIGAARYCGRFTTFKQNEASRLGGKGPTVACQPLCGDGIVDPGTGEVCESDAECVSGETCFGCDCLTGSLLGPLNFSVAPGPSGPSISDDASSSWLRVTPTLSINNGTQGNFNPGPLKLAAGFPDLDGTTPLFLTETVYIGANVPSIAGSGRACLRIEQDPSNAGEIDCNGGSNYDVDLVVDSAGTGANGTPTLTVGTGVTDSGAGAAVIRVLATAALTPDAVTPCENADYSPAPTVQTAFTTAIATSTILNPRQGGGQTVVTLGGKPFDCNAWSENGPASIAAPNLNMDVTLPVVGTLDIAQLLRLNDQ